MEGLDCGYKCQREILLFPSIHCQVLKQKTFCVTHSLHTLRVPAFCSRAEVYFHVPHLTSALSFLPFPSCPYCHQNRSSQTSMMRRYLGANQNSSRTVVLHLQISAFFSLLASEDLPWILASSAMHLKRYFTYLFSIFNCFVVEVLYGIQSVLPFSLFSLSKNFPWR